MANPKMQRAHFQLIADVLKEAADKARSQHEYKECGVALAINGFANALRATNPNFDRSRFLTACGVADA